MQNYYEIISHVGSGTFGKVFKCKHIRTGHLVAVKELVRDKFREQVLLNEVDILKKLHRNGILENHFIVQTLDIVEKPSRTWIVFELLDKSLYHLMKERKFVPLPLYQVRIIAYQLFSALQRLSELRLLHTDVKPENIMLVNHQKLPYRVKLIDFGSASRLRTSRIYQAPYIQSRFYRSPEVLIGSNFSEAIDMWSVGCVLAELSVGHPLYPGATEYDQIRYIIDMQGEFPVSILENGKKTEKYFVRAHHPKCKMAIKCAYEKEEAVSQTCRCSWRLKYPFEYKNETDIDPTESRKVLFTSLSNLAQWRRYQNTVTLPPYFDVIQHCDSLTFANLLQKTLELDPVCRIKPHQALFHDFVTAAHLSSFDARSEYVRLTEEAAIRAFNILWIYRNSSKSQSPYPVNIPHELTFMYQQHPDRTAFPKHIGDTKTTHADRDAGSANKHFVCAPQTEHRLCFTQENGNAFQANHSWSDPLASHNKNVVDTTQLPNMDTSKAPIYFPSSKIQYVNHPAENEMHNMNKNRQANYSEPPESYDSAVLYSIPIKHKVPNESERRDNGDIAKQILAIEKSTWQTTHTSESSCNCATEQFQLAVPCTHDIAAQSTNEVTPSFAFRQIS